MLIDALAVALQPLVAAVESSESLRDFLEDLGWDFDAPPTAVGSLRAPVRDLATLLATADDANGVVVARALTDARAILQSISRLGSDAALAADFRDQFPRQLVDYLVVDYLLTNQPRVGTLLQLLGVLSVEERPAAGSRPRHLFRHVAWERLRELLRRPLASVQGSYGWGTSDFAGVRLIAHVAAALEAWGLDVRDSVLDAPSTDVLNRDARRPEATTDAAIHLALVEDARDPDLLNAGVGLFVLPETSTAKPGLALLPFATAGLDEELALSDALTLTVNGTVNLTGGAGLLMRPERAVEFVLGLATGAPAPATGTLAAALRLQRAERPLTPVGTPEASRLDIGAVKTTTGTRVSAGGVDVFAEFALERSKVVIKPDRESRDGFLASVLPADGVEFETNVTIGASAARGIYFGGGGGDPLQAALDAGVDLDATLPVNLSLGPVTVPTVYLRLAAAEEGLAGEVSASVRTSIGPVRATLDRIGLTLAVDFPRGGTAPRSLDARGGFKPPSGVGLSVDAGGVVSGGGFLFHDAARGVYAGAMQLSLRGQLTVKAFGLISTRLPDGSRGYSLIVFITAEDFRPVPLGLGFTLLGIGGMVGVHRTFDEKVIRSGLRSGALAALLFPRDPVGNADTLIRSLATAFPARRGSYLLGLMAKIGWFTPTLVLMDLALILEFGSRLRLLALGRISALLPSADNDLVRLNMEAMGVIDFDAGTAALDAELVDSRLAHKFPITGSAALRAGFGEGPGFILSVGGFNPRFAAPTTVPALRRVAIALSAGNNPRLTCDAYFAITSNSVQFGADASLYASAAGFSVEGNVGFDVLVQMAPLHFIADFHAKLQLKRGSRNLFMVALAGALEGPRPLRVSGKATFSILWCDFSVRFDTTLVRGERPPLPAAVNVHAQLASALVQPTAWRTQASAAHAHGVALRSLLPTTTGPIVLDPLGQLSVTQQVVPLDTARDIELFGGAPVEGARRFTLAASLSGVPLPSAPLRADFAPAQFFEMSDDEKLAAPSFEQMDAGCVFGEAQAVFDPAHVVAAPLEYEVVPITLSGAAPTVPSPAARPRVELTAGALRDMSRSGAAGRAPIRRVGRARFRRDGATGAAALAARAWTITPLAGGPPVEVSEAVRTFAELQAVATAMNRGALRWQVVPVRDVIE